MSVIIIPTISFENLFNFKNFQQLIIDFNNIGIKEKGNLKELLEDIDYNYTEISFRDLSREECDEKSSREIIGTPKTIKLNFYKDYLFLAIDNIVSFDIGAIEIRRKKEKKYSVDEKIGFYSEVENEYIEILNKIDKINFFTLELKEKIQESINEIRDYLIDEIEVNKSEELKKIPFNLSREKIAFLFAILHREGIITGVNIPDLAGLMSKYFLHSKDVSITMSIRNRLNNYSKKENLTDKNISDFKNLLLKINP